MSRGGTALVAATVVVVGVAAYVVLGGSTDETTAAEEEAAVATAAVTRRDLAETDTFDGTLGYANERTVVSHLPGTITDLADEGSIVRRGQALYSVDGRPVTLLYGNVPAYRTLSTASENGADVRQLEWNLVALGYDPDRDLAIDTDFDWATAAAVERWQDDLGQTEDGVVELGEVVFLPGKQRVGQHATSAGAAAQPGGEVLSAASTTRVVTVRLEATRQELVNERDRVTVELPGGDEVAGTISKVGKVAETEVAPDGSETDPTIEVTIALAGQTSTDLDQAPVDVAVTRALEENALAVPVTALLALAGGGYGVELVTDGATRLVGVQTGVYADGYVQVRGDGIVEGARVVVPE
jgi:peptidoglycan hydrolase-like protein with peptidoglycan-binding domain